MKPEPIIIIDDDNEDLALLKELTIELGFPNHVVTFDDPLDALDFLKDTVLQPLFILCDINMPKLDGFQLRSQMLALESTIRDAPFLFLSTSKTQNEILQADKLQVHAYYKKSNSFEGMKEILANIMALCKIDLEKRY